MRRLAIPRTQSFPRHPGRALVNPLSSPERVNDRSSEGNCDFALLQPLEKRLDVSPILICLLKVIENTSSAFIDLAQDEHVLPVGAELGCAGFESSGPLDTL